MGPSWAAGGGTRVTLRRVARDQTAPSLEHARGPEDSTPARCRGGGVPRRRRGRLRPRAFSSEQRDRFRGILLTEGSEKQELHSTTERTSNGNSTYPKPGGCTFF